MASNGRRSSRPHLPPEQYCTMSMVSPPIANPQVIIVPMVQARRK